MKANVSFDILTKPLNISVKGRRVILFILCFLLIIPFHSFPQSDTNIVKHSPRKAIIMSACLPGLGQIYNKKYWKVPIIYAGAAAVTYNAIRNADSMRNYKNAYFAQIDSNSATINPYPYNADVLLEAKNIYRRNLELTVIVAAGIYILNIIDAAVDANLFDFNVDDNLSMKISPAVFSSAGHYSTGLSFSFNFKQPKKKIIFH